MDPDLMAFDRFIADAVESAKESLQRDRRLFARVMTRGSDGTARIALIDDIYCFHATQPDEVASQAIDLEHSQMYLAMAKTTVNLELADYAIIVHAYHRNGMQCTLFVPFSVVGKDVVFLIAMLDELPPHLEIGIFSNPYRSLQSQTRLGVWSRSISRVECRCADIWAEIRWYARRLFCC